MVCYFQNYIVINSETRDEKTETMKVKDVEQVYLGYAVHQPTGMPVTDQHTEIEMGAEEGKKRKRVKLGERKER